MDKWDARYIGLAKEVAKWSKDPSSKIGAIAVGGKGEILSTGYNGFPRHILDMDERLMDRQIKYKYIVHAEANCIYNATYNGVSLNGATMYVAGLPSCSECAKAMIQVGIKKVVMNGNPFNERWKESVQTTISMFEEARIQYEFITGEDVCQ